MRTLNNKQKKVLRKHADTLTMDGVVFYSFTEDNTMTPEYLNEIYELNPHETFIQTGERYISDYKTKQNLQETGNEN